MITPQSNDWQELDRLIDGACDRTLSADEWIELGRWLVGDREARERYAVCAELHATLAWQMMPNARLSSADLQRYTEAERDSSGVEGRCLPDALPLKPITLATNLQGASGYFSSDWPVAYLVATAVLLVGIGIGAVMRVSSPEQVAQPFPSHPSSLIPHPSSSPFVGRITGMVDCKWSDPNTAVPGPVAVPLGRKYALSSGLMEISYDMGAKVVLQGPCTYEVESASGGFLSVGKLTARVDKKEEGRTKNEELSASRSSFLIPHSYFAVRTPTAVVTDLGTEFGVEVSQQGNTSAHVFRGLIKVQSVSKGEMRDDQSVQLGENESVIVEKQSGAEQPTVRRIAIDPTSFVRHEQLAKAAEDLRLKPYRRWMAYSGELCRDPSLLAYYDFQQKEGEPGVLPNVAANGDHSLDGVVQQATWTEGRMAGKHALLFTNPSDCVTIDLPQTVDDLTLAAWVNVTSLHQDTDDGVPLFNGLLMSEGWSRPGQVHWQLDSIGRIILGQFALREGREGRVWKSSPAFDQGRLHRWAHVAAVLDRATGARFYLDGQLLGEVATDDQLRVPICIGPARIGVWDAQPRTFNGRIDELAIFGRTLSSEEIRRMFEGGNPAGGKTAER